VRLFKESEFFYPKTKTSTGRPVEAEVECRLFKVDPDFFPTGHFICARI